MPWGWNLPYSRTPQRCWMCLPRRCPPVRSAVVINQHLQVAGGRRSLLRSDPGRSQVSGWGMVGCSRCTWRPTVSAGSWWNCCATTPPPRCRHPDQRLHRDLRLRRGGGVHLLAPKGREDPATLRGHEPIETPVEEAVEEFTEDLLVAAAKSTGLIAAVTVAGERTRTKFGAPARGGA